MNQNEKLSLIERVDHSSEDQAKRALKSMILKCTVKTDTIARAIRDAIDRYTPTPTIVYQQPESENEYEVALTSSRKKPNEKKKNQDGSSQHEEDVPSKPSKRQATRRGDINPDPLVEKLILKKAKAKLNPNKKRSSDHNAAQRSPGASKKINSRHTTKPDAEIEQRAHDKSMGQSSKQKQPTVIDLVTSSEDETCDIVRLENESLEDKRSDHYGSDNDSPVEDSSDGDSSEDDSPDDESSNIVSSDDEGTGNEQQVGAITGSPERSQDVSNKRTTHASTGGDEAVHDASQSITTSMAKTSIQNNGIKMRSLGPSKKRKASEQTGEEARNDHTTQTANDTRANKRSKRIHPKETPSSKENRKCRDCGVLFPSIEQLVDHQLYCKSAGVTPTANTSADFNITDETGDLAQLRVHPNGGFQASQSVSASQLGSNTSPANSCFETDNTLVDTARCDSKTRTPSYELPLRSASSAGADSGPHIVPRRLPLQDKISIEKLESLVQSIHRCGRCGQYYDSSHNEAGDCGKSHTGRYRKRYPVGMPSSALHTGKRPERYWRWTCCGQQGRQAPACDPGKALKHFPRFKFKMADYERSPRLRQHMQKFL